MVLDRAGKRAPIRSCRICASGYRLSLELTAVRLWRELRERGYAGGYTAVKRVVCDIRPDPVTPFEVRFEDSARRAGPGRPRPIRS